MIFLIPQVAITWRLGVGDPTIAGWIITVGYLAVAILSFGVGNKRTTLSSLDKGSAKVLRAGSLLLLALGLNKQLDLQLLALEIAKSVTRHFDLAAYKPFIKIAVPVAFGMIALCGLIWITTTAKKKCVTLILPLTGWIVLGVFVVLSLCSDPLLKKIGASRQFIKWLEPVGLLLIAIGVMRWRSMQMRGTHSTPDLK